MAEWLENRGPVTVSIKHALPPTAPRAAKEAKSGLWAGSSYFRIRSLSWLPWPGQAPSRDSTHGTRDWRRLPALITNSPSCLPCRLIISPKSEFTSISVT